MSQHGAYRRRIPGHGGRIARGSGAAPQTTVRFPPDLLAHVRSRALSERTSLGEQVRLLVEWGLESVALEAAE